MRVKLVQDTGLSLQAPVIISPLDNISCPQAPDLTSALTTSSSNVIINQWEALCQNQSHTTRPSQMRLYGSVSSYSSHNLCLFVNLSGVILMFVIFPS